MKSYIFIFALVLFNILGISLFAQDDLPVEDVEVVKNFDARISNAKLLDIQAEIPSLKSNTSNSYNYDLNFHDLNIEYANPILKPLAMSKQEDKDVYHSYLKFLIGYPRSTSGQFNFAKNLKNGLEVGISGNHLWVDNENKKEFHRYMENDIGIELASLFDNGIRLSTNMDYSYNRYRLYGHPDSLAYEYTDQEVLRRYQHFKIAAHLENATITDNNFSYGVGFNYERYVNNQATRQNDFGFNLQGTRWFSGIHPLNLKIGGQFTTHKDTLELNLNNFYFEPTFTYHSDRFAITGGVNIMSSFDEFFFFPTTELKFRILDDKIMAFIGTKGDLYKNTYKSLTQFNPFLNTRIDTISNTEQFKYYAGFDGNINRIIYHIEASYSTLKNLAIFNPMGLSDENNPGIFNISYIDTASLFTLSLTSSYQINQQMEISASLVKHFYNADRDILGLPNFRFNPRLTYSNLDGNLNAWAEICIQSGTQYILENKLDKTSARYDFSLGADYLFNKYLGVSLQVNNLLGNKYEKFYHYPTIGAQAQVGIVARF